MLRSFLMARVIFGLLKLGFIAAVLLCLFPPLTSFLTVPLAKFHAAAASGTLTGNRIVDHGVDALPVNGAIENINKFPAWAQGEAQALPGQVAPVDSCVAGKIPNVSSAPRFSSQSSGSINWLHAGNALESERGDSRAITILGI
jgi:hypothetical protein